MGFNLDYQRRFRGRAKKEIITKKKPDYKEQATDQLGKATSIIMMCQAFALVQIANLYSQMV